MRVTANESQSMNRRELMTLVGKVAGSAAMYQMMSSLALAANSTFDKRFGLSGAPKGTSVLILGGGLAGMVAAYELQKAGYKVQILEYNNRTGGRNWSLYGGDTYTELGGITQRVQFDKGLYFNPGPWRIPYNHQGILHYAKMLGVTLEPFNQANYAAYIHSQNAFGGKPQRYRAVKADFEGHVAELLSKSVQQSQLDQAVTKEDKEILLQALRSWGALDQNYRYVKGRATSNRRGYDHPPGGGLDGEPTFTDPVGLSDLLRSGLWGQLSENDVLNDQPTLFQPVGGMGVIGRKFGELLKNVIRLNAKVIDIKQDETGVTATYVDTVKGGAPQTARGDWCVCTIPASILGQIPMNVSPAMQQAIYAIPYGASCKVGLQMKRRFWEEDEDIYGGITYTDQMNAIIAYPNTDYFSKGKGVLLGAYTFGPNASIYTSMTPEERIRNAVQLGANIHPQYRTEFESGVAVAWHRVPWTLGCQGTWSEDARATHYKNICQIDGRIVLAGEHVSMIPAWQEGAVTSSIDAITRLHQRIVRG